MEIFGHEFWSAGGKTIWYDLQTPRGEDFWLAAYNLDAGARTWYHLQRNEYVRALLRLRRRGRQGGRWQDAAVGPVRR